MHKSSFFLLSALSLSMFTASANTLVRTPNNFEFNFVEGNRLDIGVDASYGFIDNFLFQKSEEKDTSYLSLQAKAFIQMHDDSHLFQGSIDATQYWFSNFDEDDHSDLNTRAKYFYKLNDFHSLFASISSEEVYEYRGTGLTRNVPLVTEQGDSFTDTMFNAGYRYGRSDSISRVNVLVGQYEHDYDTRIDVTKVLHQQNDFVHLGIDYLLSGKTYISLKGEYQDVSFDNSPAQNRDQLAALVGIKWEPTDISRLLLYLGYESLNFDQKLFNDSDVFKWRFSYQWHPVNNLRLSIDSARETDESIDIDINYRLIDAYAFSATYGVSEYVEVGFNASLNAEETHFIADIRTEDYINSRLSMRYIFSPRLSAHLLYNYSGKSGENSFYDYDQNKISIGVKANF